MKLGLALPGPHRGEAERIQRYCVDQGMSWKRAYCVAAMASLSNSSGFSWAFQESVAKFCGVSRRTVQRAMRQAKKLGVMVSRRIRRGERPPGQAYAYDCGGALRRFVGWGRSVAQALARYARYALRWIWREDAIKRRAERERAELDLALADLRGPPE